MRLMPTISTACSEDFSRSAFGLRTTTRLVSGADRAAVFAARINGAGEQPGRERPHLWTADPGPRVGSGVAHIPAAGDGNDEVLAVRIRGDTESGLCRETRTVTGLEVRLISSVTVDDFKARFSAGNFRSLLMPSCAWNSAA